MDNLTVESDFTMPREQIPQSRALQFVNALEVILKNCVFQNNQNFVAFTFRNYPRNTFYEEITESYLTLENITMLNNTYIDDSNGVDLGFFVLYSPMKPANVLFANSFFYNNTVGKLFIEGKYIILFLKEMD